MANVQENAMIKNFLPKTKELFDMSTFFSTFADPTRLKILSALCLSPMFVGDLIFKGSIGRTDLEGANEEDMINSLKKIIKFEENIKIYPGHGPSTYLNEEKKTNPYLKVENYLWLQVY